ncbi:hypothetical protein [Bradyrhizobium sp. SYSU BS000235]|uniref:hypothetical protein n=1 Tax=Bradyrhizobium sp. SYSU BS000235 TaxID=3411332 RepID=UPI003C74DA8F
MKPTLTEQERAAVSRSVQSLSEILQPARDRGQALEIVIGKLFAGFNVYTGDEGKLKAQVAVWCGELEEFPFMQSGVPRSARCVQIRSCLHWRRSSQMSG